MKDSEESGSGGINMYDNLTKDDIKKMQEEVVDESNFVCCIMDLYLPDCKWTEQSVYVF